MKKLNRKQKLALAFACVACVSVGSVYAEGTPVDPATVISGLNTSITAVINALLGIMGALITLASGIWLSILAYKRARSATKSVVS